MKQTSLESYASLDRDEIDREYRAILNAFKEEKAAFSRTIWKENDERYWQPRISELQARGLLVVVEWKKNLETGRTSEVLVLSPAGERVHLGMARVADFPKKPKEKKKAKENSAGAQTGGAG